MIGHQLAPELERVLPGRVRQLVHEALEIDGVLVVVHAAPEPWRDRRVAHGVVDQQVRDGVAELRLPVPPALRPWNVAGSRPFCSPRGFTAARIDWPEMRMCSPVRLLLASKRAGELALRDRVIDAVRRVVFTRLDQLDRRARHLLGDPHRVADIFAARPPAEAAAEDGVVHVALFDRQSGRLAGGRKRGFAVLRAGPDLALVRPCSARSRSSAPWRRGSGTDRRRPPRPSWPRRRSPPWRRPAGCRRTRPGRRDRP